MGRTVNDGRGRLGGRAKGTPNKPQASFGVWAEGVLSKNRRYIENQVNTPSNSGAAALLSALVVAASIDRLTAQLATLAPQNSGTAATQAAQQ